VKAMVEAVVHWFGRVDCLINNAGIPSLSPASPRWRLRVSTRYWP
jgi:NAD(P)-dependent dehydrogenase (short-subunit alcohol dehydrogenase family)